MDAHNVLIAAPNLADKAVFAGGNWEAPLANAQTRDLKQVARSVSADPSATWGTVVTAREETIGALGLVNHNLSPAAKIRWRAFTDVGMGTERWSSDWLDIWPRIRPTSMMAWTDANWFTGKYTQEELTGLTPTWAQIPSGSVAGKYWKWEIQDPTNAKGKVEIGRVVMARSAQPEFNFSYGLTLGYQDNSVIDELEDGRERCELRPLRRVATFTLEHLSTDQAYAFALDLQRRLGLWGEALLCLNPTDTRWLHVNTFWARLRQLQPVTKTDVIRYSFPFDWIEIVR